MYKKKDKTFDHITVVTLICMDAERGRDMAKIIKEAKPFHCLVKDLFYDSKLGEKDCPKILIEAMKEKPDVELLILNNINPNFRRYRDNEEFSGWMDDYAHMSYMVDLMYLEDKYKHHIPNMLKKMECEADYARASIAMYLTNGEDDEHEFIHKYSKKEEEESSSEEEEEKEDENADEDTDEDEDMDDIIEKDEGDFINNLVVIDYDPVKNEDVQTYHLTYLKHLTSPPLKPNPKHYYFLKFD